MTRARLNELIEQHCRFTGAVVADFQRGSRTKECTQARTLVIRDLTAAGVSSVQIGKWLGIHHTSVLYQQKKQCVYSGPIPVPDLSGEWAI